MGTSAAVRFAAADLFQAVGHPDALRDTAGPPVLEEILSENHEPTELRVGEGAHSGDQRPVETHGHVSVPATAVGDFFGIGPGRAAARSRWDPAAGVGFPAGGALAGDAPPTQGEGDAAESKDGSADHGEDVDAVSGSRELGQDLRGERHLAGHVGLGEPRPRWPRWLPGQGGRYGPAQGKWWSWWVRPWWSWGVPPPSCSRASCSAG